MTEEPVADLFGLEAQFTGLVPQRESEREHALRAGLLSLDASFLLDFYRFTPESRRQLAEVLEAVGPRAFVSHQAAKEFWRNRASTIEGRNSLKQQLFERMDKVRVEIASPLGHWARKAAVPEDLTRSIQERIRIAFDECTELVEGNLNSDETFQLDRPERDDVVKTLTGILRAHVGPALSSEDLADARAEANRRVEHKVPPGYRDAKKSDESEDGSTGDYLVWRQSLIEAKRRGLPLVIVTSDDKEDWWWKRGSRLLGPRRELVEECTSIAGQALYMLRPTDLIRHANAIQVRVTTDAASDIAWASDSSPRWNARAVHELLSRLDSEGRPQAEVIRFAASEGGLINRADVYRLAGRDEDRMLRGFTRPVSRITSDLQQAGMVGMEVEPMLTPNYGTGVTAEQFEIPLDVVEILSNAEGAPDSSESVDG